MTGQNNDSPAAAPGSNTLSHFGQTSMDREIAEISEAMPAGAVAGAVRPLQALQQPRLSLRILKDVHL